MDPNHPNYRSWLQNFPNYSQSSEYPSSQNFPNFASYENPPFFSNSEYSQNTKFSPNLSQIPISQEVPTSENITRNLFGGAQSSNKNRKGSKNVSWSVKEDVVLMSSWIYASEDNIRGKNQKGESLWARVHKLYHDSQVDNPDEMNERNIESMKCRWKRLNENANKWLAACREAETRRRSGMSDKDVEKEAHSIYNAGGSKFQDLVVFNEVMSKHPKWSLHGTTHVLPDTKDVDDQQSGGSSKRSKTSESGEFSIPSNPETPVSGYSTSSRPIGRDKAKRKGKGKATQSDSANEQVAGEIRALRLAKDSEHELLKTRLDLEREKMQRNSMKMKEKMLIKLLEKDQLSPEDEDMKRRLVEIVFGK